MSALAIGIDLGTSTSEIAVFRHGEPEPISDPGTKSPIVPSLIAVDKQGKLLVGEEARRFVDNEGYGVREVKRMMRTGKTVTLNGKTYRPEELSSLILTLLKTNAEIALGETVTDVVLSVPANFDDAAKNATLNAATLAGLNVIQLINEPTAAAIAFGIKNIETEAQLVVFDFGGGTLDVTTLEMMEGVLEVKSSFGDPCLGGKDFDEYMIQLILRKFKAEHGDLPNLEQAGKKLKGMAEKAKIALTSIPSYNVIYEYFIKKGDNLIDLDVEVMRAEYEAEIAPLLARARECLMKALKAGQLRPSAIDKILMVGGTTYMPCVREMVTEFFGKELKTEISPDLAVAQGASTLAGIKIGLVDARESLVFSDVCPMGIGIDVITTIGNQDILTYKSLVRPNTPIPFSATYPLSLYHADQRELVFQVFQTHLNEEVIPLELGLSQQIIREIGLHGKIDDIPPAQYGQPHPLKIDFSYGQNGTITIAAVIPGMNKNASLSFEYSKFRMSDEELGIARKRVRDLLSSSEFFKEENIEETPALSPPAPEMPHWEEHPLARRFTPLINRAERLSTEQPEHRVKLEEAILELKRALEDGNEQAIETTGDELTDLLFDLQN